MNNTIMTAKNTFSEGLIMDFAPDNTQANTLTSALNATLVTFNGNELSLQNDMGNGRVETARLPEGYVPVGTCEFGGIIYIVSYNPILNKSQIGCFPSPERNISSREISDLVLQLASTDFQKFEKKGELETPTGDLINLSTKKVLIESHSLNPGDKYIIYDSDAKHLTNNSTTLMDYMTLKSGSDYDTNVKGNVILKVISIADNGKVTELDSTTKWYDIKNTGKYKINYIDNEGLDNEILFPQNVSTYRNLLETNWSIFSSKNSGKLAILAELATIDSFSCSYSVSTIEDEIRSDKDSDILIKYKKYTILLHPDYTSETLPLAHVLLTKSLFGAEDNWTSENTLIPIELTVGAPIIMTNPVAPSKDTGWLWGKDSGTTDSINLYTFEIPYEEILTDGTTVRIKSKNLIYTMEVTPAMEYGRLDHLALKLLIDFNNIGSGDINLQTWKYHVNDNAVTLQYGLEAYPKNGDEIKDITIKFYDNNGLVGLYHLADRLSYNGIFTEHLGLNGNVINSRFSNEQTNAEGELERILHKGAEFIPEDNNIIDPQDVYEIEVGGKKQKTNFLNDSGYIYSGLLYAAQIEVRYGSELETTLPKDYHTKIFKRWMWTVPLYNEQYYQILDFKTLKFRLAFDNLALVETIPENYIWEKTTINNLYADFEETKKYKTYSANMTHIGQGLEKKPNLTLYSAVGLQNDFGVFNLHKDIVDHSNIRVYLAEVGINYDRSEEHPYSYSLFETPVSEPHFLALDNLEDIVRTDGTEKRDFLTKTSLSETPITEHDIVNDAFNITFTNLLDPNYDLTKLPTLENGPTYTGYNNYQLYTGKLNTCYYCDKDHKAGIPLTMAALFFNKAYTEDITDNISNLPVYVPLIHNKKSMEDLGISGKYVDGRVIFGFNSGIVLNNYNSTTFSISDLDFHTDDLCFYSSHVNDYYPIADKMIDTTEDMEWILKQWVPVKDRIKPFFAVYPGGDSGVGNIGVCLSKYNTQQHADVRHWTDFYTRNAANVGSGKEHQLMSKPIGVSNTNFTNTNPSADNLNVIAFVGCKYKEGFTLFNSATAQADAVVEGRNSKIVQYNYPDKYPDHLPNTQANKTFYRNSAVPLYLLLSNTYHRLCTDTSISVKTKMRNCVRPNNYIINLKKNIIIELFTDTNLSDSNQYLLFHGLPFNKYVSEVSAFLTKSDNVVDELSDINVNLESAAKITELTLVMKDDPLEMKANEEAFFLNGQQLAACDPIPEGVFKINNNGVLEDFANKEYQFNRNLITLNFRRDLNLNLNIIKLKDYPDETNYIPEPRLLAWKYFESKLKPAYDNIFKSHKFEFYSELEKSLCRSDLYHHYERMMGGTDNVHINEFEEWLKGFRVFLTEWNSAINTCIKEIRDSSQIKISEEELQLVVNNVKIAYLPAQCKDLGVFAHIQGMEGRYPSEYLVKMGEKDLVKENTICPFDGIRIYVPFPYKVTPGLAFNSTFTYDGELKLNPDVEHSRFGIWDSWERSGKNIDYGFTGFMRDMVVDSKQEIVNQKNW